ncbi:MAG: hypothetical protein OXT67_14140 [Zetaproteobacteria bacterium]|nr:hypothetical protein [Zetaproteobacteria bacterium]
MKQFLTLTTFISALSLNTQPTIVTTYPTQNLSPQPQTALTQDDLNWYRKWHHRWLSLKKKSTGLQSVGQEELSEKKFNLLRGEIIDKWGFFPPLNWEPKIGEPFPPHVTRQEPN